MAYQHPDGTVFCIVPGAMTDHSLLSALTRLAEIQREMPDRLALREAVMAGDGISSGIRDQLNAVAIHLGVDLPVWVAAPDGAHLPALVCHDEKDWAVLAGQNAQGQWIIQFWSEKQNKWIEEERDNLNNTRVFRFRLTAPFAVGNSPVFALVKAELLTNRGVLAEAALGGLVIGILGIVVSFYSLQVYDRVIPAGAMQTLLVLSMGALAAVGMEWLARRARTHLHNSLIDRVDQRLARTVYLRLLAVRLDQLPRSVGSLAAQMRGYETVRAFMTLATSSALVDLPFMVIFLGLIAIIGGSLATIPLIFFVAAVTSGLLMHKRMEAAAKVGATAGNFKTGLLVETVEGAETIKSGQGGWRMLSRWLKNTDDARNAEMESRRLSEQYQHMMGAFQQFSYILLVSFGAWLVSRGELTMGGLIACTILAGRVLNPVALIAGQVMQWSHAKAALEGLDHLWKLEDDHHGHAPVMLAKIAGHYQFESVSLRYGNMPALGIPQLEIRPGERVGIVGPVGAGKTTLLRLLSGMYKPQEGLIRIDGVDLAQVSKPLLAESLGYLQQEGRLFAGSLRENLILGMIDPGDDAILEAARLTGLMQAVIASHPKGLQQEIHEGGNGLSGCQRQLVNLTRVFLRRPKIWLLDEPTASVDSNIERQIIDLLEQNVAPEATLVLVTHKPEMLKLVNRLIVIANHRIVMDGPTAHVLASLQGGSA
jgi:ATP-binding cassette subfamily C protein LapB